MQYRQLLPRFPPNYNSLLMSPTADSLTLKQEIANTISHGLGILFGLVAIPLLLAQVAKSDQIILTLGVSVYAFSFLLVYTCSTLYHGFQQPMVKNILQILDHISIYFMIAGSYTPFILLYVYNQVGITILLTLWGLTFVGIVFKIFFTHRFKYLSTTIYVLMGWMLLAGGKTFFVNLPADVLMLIVVGGILYSLGVIFFLWEKLFYHHLIWHLFVLAASICHFMAVVLAVTGK